jgi:hypothetical protein
VLLARQRGFKNLDRFFVLIGMNFQIWNLRRNEKILQALPKPGTIVLLSAAGVFHWRH